MPALALGMSRSAGVRTIVLPQAVMRVLPALASDLGVAVQGHLARLDHRGRRSLLRVAARSARETYRILEVLTAMAVLYWLMGYPQAKLVDWIHRRYKVVE